MLYNFRGIEWKRELFTFELNTLEYFNVLVRGDDSARSKWLFNGDFIGDIKNSFYIVFIPMYKRTQYKITWIWKQKYCILNTISYM